MATIKAYTDLEQSRKLAEILPLESADMRFCFSHTLDGRTTGHYPMIGKEPSLGTIPCWSLVALLDTFPEGYTVELTKSFNCTDYYCKIDGKPFETEAENPVDACVELIIKLNELKML